jgi:4-hydroxybenzoate polyprenyltransferase
VSVPQAGAGLAERAVGLLRLTHPFPSFLDGLATAVIALLAGASTGDAARLGAAMVALQASIGVTNDISDAPADAVAKPAKPIPAGLVSARAAGVLAVLLAVVGLALSAVSGWGTLGVAAAGLGVGLVYDVRLKGTAWSWLPFAVGIPLLPVYAWYGGTGSLPASFAVLVPAAMAAGAALAIGNARADAEADRASGVASIATALGPRRAWALEVTILLVVGVVAVASAALVDGSTGRVAIVAAAALVPVGAALASRHRTPAGRERAWEAEAIGVAALGAAWLWVAVA